MAGQVVVVTGAATGVGRALAVEAGRRGAKVVIADVVDGADAVSEVTAAGGDAVPYIADVTDYAAVEALAAFAVATYGGVNVIVNNAALASGSAPLDVADPGATRRLFDVGILGVFHGIRAFADALKRTAASGGRAVVLNVGSEHSLGVPPHVAAISTYTVSKYAVLGLSDTARRDLAQHGVQVTLLAPGWVRTEKVLGIVRSSPAAAQAIEPFAQSPEAVAAAAWDGVAQGFSIVATNPASREFAIAQSRAVMAEVQRLPAPPPLEEHIHNGTGDPAKCPVAHIIPS
jgi:NAD(P)-dependent dehydrogenase (short-subunit alcohol dehydrogenase family)